jgi:CheY-like chemotaxis protein
MPDAARAVRKGPDRLVIPRIRLLLLEDEALVAMFIEDVLQDLGCEVVKVATSVRSALRFLAEEEESINAAILDVNLGDETAYPVAAALNERGIPFAFATGYGTAGIREDFTAAPVITKPFGERALEDAVIELSGQVVALRS